MAATRTTKHNRPVRFGLALDMGNSSMKLRFGEVGGDPKESIRPVGAAPQDRARGLIAGGGLPRDLMVKIGDESWIAGVEKTRLGRIWRRSLHCDYPKSQQYQALFKSALMLTGRDTIDVLSIGLPLEQYKDEGRRAELKAGIEGEHPITTTQSVAVKSSLVIPHAAGAFFELLAEVDKQKDTDNLRLLNEGTTLIFDPGLVSVDWAVMDKGVIRYDCSGSSMLAISFVIEELVDAVRKDYGMRPQFEQIELAIRLGHDYIWLRGRKVFLHDYLAPRAQQVVFATLQEVKRHIQRSGIEIDLVVPVGGGSEIYLNGLRDQFFPCVIRQLENPVMANARGLWHALETQEL